MDNTSNTPEITHIESIEKVQSISNERLELIQRFIELDKQKAAVKEFYDNYDNTVKEMIEVFGLDFHFQDSDGTVYVTDTMEWKSIRMTSVQVKRTRREGETKGSLSLTEARSYGYEVEGK